MLNWSRQVVQCGHTFTCKESMNIYDHFSCDFITIMMIAIVYNSLAYIRVLQYHVDFDDNVIIISNTYTALLHVRSCCPSDFEGFCIYKAQKKEQDGSNDA